MEQRLPGTDQGGRDREPADRHRQAGQRGARTRTIGVDGDVKLMSEPGRRPGPTLRADRGRPAPRSRAKLPPPGGIVARSGRPVEKFNARSSPPTAQPTTAARPARHPRQPGRTVSRSVPAAGQLAPVSHFANGPADRAFAGQPSTRQLTLPGLWTIGASFSDSGAWTAVGAHRATADRPPREHPIHGRSRDDRPPRLHPRHPRFPQAGHPVQGHHAAL